MLALLSARRPAVLGNTRQRKTPLMPPTRAAGRAADRSRFHPPCYRTSRRGIAIDKNRRTEFRTPATTVEPTIGLGSTRVLYHEAWMTVLTRGVGAPAILSGG